MEGAAFFQLSIVVVNPIYGEVEVVIVTPLVAPTVRRQGGLRIGEGRIDPAHQVRVDQARAVQVQAQAAPDLHEEGLRIRRKVKLLLIVQSFLIFATLIT